MAQGAKLHHVDTSYHLQQASNAFFANRWILQDHQILIATRPKSLAKVRTTVACFAAGHRAFYKNDLVNMDVSWTWLTENYAEDCWTSTWHEKDFGMARLIISVEQTGTTFRSTDQCQIPVAVNLYTLLEIRKACGTPPFPQMSYMYISLDYSGTP